MSTRGYLFCLWSEPKPDIAIHQAEKTLLPSYNQKRSANMMVVVWCPTPGSQQNCKLPSSFLPSHKILFLILWKVDDIPTAGPPWISRGPTHTHQMRGTGSPVEDKGSGRWEGASGLSTGQSSSACGYWLFSSPPQCTRAKVTAFTYWTLTVFKALCPAPCMHHPTYPQPNDAGTIILHTK